MKPLIAIHACHKYSDLRQAVRETWVAKWGHLIDIKFFVGQPAGDEPDVVYLDCPDDFWSLGLKNSGSSRYARAHGYTNLFKCDDDTFVHVPRLLSSGFEQWEYTGRRCQANNFVYAQGGAGYWIGPRLIDVMADISDGWWRLKPAMHNQFEDLGTGIQAHFHKFGLKDDTRYFHATTNTLGYPAPGNNFITAHKCNRWRHEHFIELNTNA